MSTHQADDAAVLVERTAGLTAVLGAFVMVSTAVFTITDTLGIHNVLVGALVALLASVHAYRTGEQRSPSIVLAAVLTLLGVWIAAAPYVINSSQALAVGINGLAGVFIAILSLIGIYGSVRTTSASAASA
ncbi:SPW repeat domain-containing protein [Natrinema sp. CGMCC1.2065]|uniref:SPW repeat domain-containing protein n=1 Tax=Natrinema sp. CGMCC1.2065 TaxID=3445767 RepID=UPI003F4A053D